MKMKYIMPAIILLLLSSSAAACVSPTDSFSSEVLLNKAGINYDLTDIKTSKNVTLQEGAVIYRSHYNPEVAVVLAEANTEYQKGLSIRLQVPTRFVNISYPQIRIELEPEKELSLNEDLLESLGYEIKGRLLEGKIKAELKKGNIGIAVWSIKTDSELHSGIHITVLNATLNPELEKELKSIVLSFGAGEESWNSRKITAQTIERMNLVPAVIADTNAFNFSEAMETELVWLRDNGVVSGLTDADINEIESVAKKGTAGYNSRVVHFKGSWLPYFRTDKPLLRVGTDCDGFPLTALPDGTAILSSGSGESVDSAGLERDNADASESKQTPQAPGFGVILSVISLLVVTMRRRKK